MAATGYSSVASATRTVWFVLAHLIRPGAFTWLAGSKQSASIRRIPLAKNIALKRQGWHEP
jgi:hypothetical protein